MHTFKQNLVVLFTVLLGASFYAKAQLGYIVTLQNDTINGEIKSNGIYMVKFVAEGSKEKKKYEPEELKSYYIKKKESDEYYESITLPKYEYKAFAKCLEKGKINLYQVQIPSPGAMSPNGRGGFVMAGGGYSGNWYIEKEGFPITLLKADMLFFNKKKSINVFLTFIEDNPKITEEFKKANDFSFDFLRKIIKDYNEVAPAPSSP